MVILWAACLLANENLQGNYFLRFFPTEAGDFTCLAGFFSLMWEILQACRESGRNRVQAGDSLSMRESWKPWVILEVHYAPGALLECILLQEHTCYMLLQHCAF